MPSVCLLLQGMSFVWIDGRIFEILAVSQRCQHVGAMSPFVFFGQVKAWRGPQGVVRKEHSVCNGGIDFFTDLEEFVCFSTCCDGGVTFRGAMCAHGCMSSGSQRGGRGGGIRTAWLVRR